jgi:hypothetical protein
MAGVVGLSFSACGASTDGLFTIAGGASSTGGTSTNRGGSSSGGPDTSGGSFSSAGNNAEAGMNANGGSDASGGHTNGGGGSLAGSNNAGGSSGDNGGSSNAGTSSASAGGNAGTSSAGTSSAGSGGTSAGIGGDGGAGGTPSCQELTALLESQLNAARACDDSHNALQCTGKVTTTCGCQTPVESSDSAETKAYLATLKRFQDKHCVIACTALVCLPFQRAQCKAQGSAGGGVCIAVSGPITQ